MTIPAHSIKPGDTINGIEVFDGPRRTFGGFFIPMIDGSRISIKAIDTLITID